MTLHSGWGVLLAWGGGALAGGGGVVSPYATASLPEKVVQYPGK